MQASERDTGLRFWPLHSVGAEACILRLLTCTIAGIAAWLGLAIRLSSHLAKCQRIFMIWRSLFVSCSAHQEGAEDQVERRQMSVSTSPSHYGAIMMTMSCIAVVKEARTGRHVVWSMGRDTRHFRDRLCVKSGDVVLASRRLQLLQTHSVLRRQPLF